MVGGGSVVNNQQKGLGYGQHNAVVYARPPFPPHFLPSCANLIAQVVTPRGGMVRQTTGHMPCPAPYTPYARTRVTTPSPDLLITFSLHPLSKDCTVGTLTAVMWRLLDESNPHHGLFKEKEMCKPPPPGPQAPCVAGLQRGEPAGMMCSDAQGVKQNYEAHCAGYGLARERVAGRRVWEMDKRQWQWRERHVTAKWVRVPGPLNSTTPPFGTVAPQVPTELLWV